MPKKVDAIFSCNGGQVILVSSAIDSHLRQCAAIKEIDSGENFENCVLAAPDGEPPVKLRHLWVDVFRKEGGVEGDKETKHIEEGGKKQGRGKNPEERMGRECEERGTDDDSTVTDDSFTVLDGCSPKP
jgi:hypothetical protein